jgi:topoisomerase IV subunit A
LPNDDLKGLVQHNFLEYASYVILDRAIPNVVDGLKPVQRRILHTLSKMDDGKLHKVANVVGQTMAFHPHGDAAIGEALINLANKDFLLDKQGNFGNLYTGDPAAAVRYIETRLSGMARETLFNADLTEFLPSYDARNLEPVVLPAKLPVLLMHGAEGIAVGMATKILPHNFCELIEAEIAHLEGKTFEIFPDFPTGGIADCSEYDKGNGKVRLRAKMKVVDDKTIVIHEICYGTTTESLIRSVDEAAKRGKIKIDSINDYTAEKVEIEIILPRGHHAKELIDQLYAFTDCQVSLSPSLLVIKDNLPWETDTHQVIELHADLLKSYLKRELELERDRLLEKIYGKTLEQIFIENRLYKTIETVKTYEGVHEAIKKALTPFHKELERKPEKEDRERLLAIPIRRISAFDLAKNEEEIRALEDRLADVEKKLKNIKKTTITYLKELLKKYGKDHPRRTQLEEIEQLDRRAIETKMVKVGFDVKTGWLGTKVVSDTFFECTNFDKVLVFHKQGSFKVINLPEKMFVHNNGETVIYAGVADKKTLFRVVYTDVNGHAYAKRFLVNKFIVDRLYDFVPAGATLDLLTTDEGACVEVEFKTKARQRVKKVDFLLDEAPIKGVKTRGIRISNGKEVKKIRRCKKK